MFFFTGMMLVKKKVIIFYGKQLFFHFMFVSLRHD